MLYQVKELADLYEVTSDTIRYYTKIGLLQPVRNSDNGYRQYTKNDSKQLAFIKTAKCLGYNLKEIQHIIVESKKGKSPCPFVRDLITHRIHANRVHIEQLMELQIRMEKALKNWETMQDGTPNENTICHLIESISTTQE